MSTKCPQCQSADVKVVNVRINSKTGEPMKPARWIGGAVGVFVLSCIVNSILILGLSSENLGIAAVIGGIVSWSGLVAAVVMIIRYIRAPQEKRMRCQSCSHQWDAADASGDVVRDQLLQQGIVNLAVGMYEPGTYDHEALGLITAKECVYCGQPATQTRKERVSRNTKDADGEITDAWAFDLEFPYCDQHYKTAKRNNQLLSTAFGVGMFIGFILAGIWFVQDPEGALRAIGEPLSLFINSWWMGLIAILAVVGIFCMLIGFLVQMIVRLVASRFIKSLRDQHGLQLGVASSINDKTHDIVLKFTRNESAQTYRELNSAVIGSWQAQRAEATAEQARAERSEIEVTTQAVQEALVEEAATCWYCDKGVPADGTPHNVVLAKGENDERVEEVIWIPRCAACEQVHKSNTPLFSVGAVVGVLVFMVLCILIGLIDADRFIWWRWLIGLVVLLIGTVAVIAAAGYIAQKRADKAGTRVESAVNQGYSQVKEKIDAGWQLDTTKTGKSK